MFNSQEGPKQAKLKKLSESQEALLNETLSKWINATLMKKPFDEHLIKDFIVWLYAANDLAEPEIHFAHSPFGSQHIASRLRAASPDWRNLRNLVPDAMGHLIFNLPKVVMETRHLIMQKARTTTHAKVYIERQMQWHTPEIYEPFSEDLRHAQWCSYYDFCCEAGLVRKRIASIDAYSHYLLNSGIFMTIYERKNVIVCLNPNKILFNEKGELHCLEGPAAVWDDGFKLSFEEGRSKLLPETSNFLLDNRYDLSSQSQLKKSAVRQEPPGKRYAEILIHGPGVRIIDKWSSRWGTYELFAVDIAPFVISRVDLRYLRMTNPSTGESHTESVPPVRSCRQALAWRDGDHLSGSYGYIVPGILT